MIAIYPREPPDGVPDAELAALPVRFFNGRANDWMHEPAETRHL
jgi:hypothetical protein